MARKLSACCGNLQGQGFLASSSSSLPPDLLPVSPLALAAASALARRWAFFSASGRPSSWLLLVEVLAVSAALPPDCANATDAVRAARDQCANIGGVMEQAGRMGRYACYAQYADAGTSCNDSSECSGDCRAEPDATTGQMAKGVCTANNNPFGCHARVGADGKL